MVAAGLTIGLSASGVLAVDDGTGGPTEATPNAAMCDRPLASAETIASFSSATPGVIMGQIETIDSAAIGSYPVITGETADAITQTLQSFGGCIQKAGPEGAYAFLKPGITDGELIFLGVFDPGATPEGTPGTGQKRVPDFTPKLIVQLTDDQIGAVVTSPQANDELALLTLVNENGQWLIAKVTPVTDDGSGGSSGGGP
jgi:hypothetical protein